MTGDDETELDDERDRDEERNLNDEGILDDESVLDDERNPDDECEWDAELTRIRARAETVRDEQVARTLSHLDAHGELTTRQRGGIERLADRLVERLLAVPEAALVTATEGDDADAEAVVALFRE